MNTTITVVLFTSKTLANGEHPLMLRLTKNRKLKYISLHLSLPIQFWDVAKGRPRRNCPNRERINALIDQKIKEYEDQIIDYKTCDRDYTLQTLISKASKQTVRRTVGEYLDSYIDRLLAEKRVGNAKTFQELRTLLIRFCQSLDFYFVDVDAHWLQQLTQWMRSAGYSDNSIGIRFRSLRALYNRAIEENVARRSNYPFDTFKVSQFREETVK